MDGPGTISRDVARRFLAIRHLLAPPRGLPAEPESVLAVVDRLGSLQFDPLAVAGRNHDLVLHARIAGYDPRWAEELLYGRRLLFETYNKGLSLLPTRELPWYRISWDRDAIAHQDATFAAHRETVEAILERIRREGPLSTRDLGPGATIEWYWGPTSSHRAVLEALAEAGILGLARREGNRRFYDLVERLFPADLLAARVAERDQLRHKLLSRYRGHGLLGATGSGELWSGVRPHRGPDGTLAGHPTRAELLAELIDRGELTPVGIEGVRGRRYLVTDELPMLAQAEREVAGATVAALSEATAAGVAFLAPLDPLVWDRAFLRDLYGFDYVWEVYVPAAKRRWGYYVLPILFGDRLVGRIEPRFDRGANALRVIRTWWETGFDPLAAPGFADALGVALESYRRFGGVDRIVWARRRTDAPLARALRDRAPVTRSAASQGPS